MESLPTSYIRRPSSPSFLLTSRTLALLRATACLHNQQYMGTHSAPLASPPGRRWGKHGCGCSVQDHLDMFRQVFFVVRHFSHFNPWMMMKIHGATATRSGSAPNDVVVSTPAHESSFLSAASGDTLFWDTLNKMGHGLPCNSFRTKKCARTPSGSCCLAWIYYLELCLSYHFQNLDAKNRPIKWLLTHELSLQLSRRRDESREFSSCLMSRRQGLFAHSEMKLRKQFRFLPKIRLKKALENRRVCSFGIVFSARRTGQISQWGLIWNCPRSVIST